MQPMIRIGWTPTEINQQIQRENICSRIFTEKQNRQNFCRMEKKYINNYEWHLWFGLYNICCSVDEILQYYREIIWCYFILFFLCSLNWNGLLDRFSVQLLHFNIWQPRSDESRKIYINVIEKYLTNSTPTDIQWLSLCIARNFFLCKFNRQISLKIENPFDCFFLSSFGFCLWSIFGF